MGRKHYIIVQRVKNIIVLCDGTWNGLSTKTNVYDLYQLLMKQGQQPWYRQGVGTKVSNIFFFLNGALALELDDIIMEAYKKIVEEYNEEINEFESKEIWLFGFSRGAYIVRCVAGMIRNCGILKFNNEGLIKRAYEIYRSRDPAHDTDGYESKDFRDAFTHDLNRPIRFLGLWDTVGAHGIPTYTIGKGFEYLKFYDQNVSNVVHNACQVLSIHERLILLEPCRIYKNSDASLVKIEETWFPGKHLEVGGGILSNNEKISSQSLLWMIGKVQRAGDLLEIKEEYNDDDIQFDNKFTRMLLSFWRLIFLKWFNYIIVFLFTKTILFRDRVIPLYTDETNRNILKRDLIYKNGHWGDSFGDLKSQYSSRAYLELNETMRDAGIDFPPE
ncbi:12057_t:CDS:1 [Funneliformis caledonium]|uniref:12057_t:CDS:1 n=2 Tax=Funneliformis TaxID=1117308 RepID=A0A9N9HCK6_9GLOM|nr:12057_t:CDS:1 [Funneliformis caledonium]